LTGRSAGRLRLVIVIIIVTIITIIIIFKVGEHGRFFGHLDAGVWILVPELVDDFVQFGQFLLSVEMPNVGQRH
jgi:hypothetical protein